MNVPAGKEVKGFLGDKVIWKQNNSSTRSLMNYEPNTHSDLINGCPQGLKTDLPQAKKHNGNITTSSKTSQMKVDDEKLRNSETISQHMLRGASYESTTYEKKTFDVMWLNKYNDLKNFYARYGHCYVPQRYLPNRALGKWVHKQRQEFKKKILTEERVQALNALDFQFTISNRAESLWYVRLEELKAYRKQHGHCKVPQKYPPNKTLGMWVHRQRHELSKARKGASSSLTVDRLDALEKLGFDDNLLNEDVCEQKQ